MRRRDIPPDQYYLLRAGEYMKGANSWWACTPNGAIANLSRHDIAEHADGTITASPVVALAGGSWHGFLEHGEWREV